MGKLKDREINYLGALLHDIGKLVWRASEVKENETHEKLGENFIREELGKIECLKEDIEEIVKAANRNRGKIWLADVISAGEREESHIGEARRYLQAITNRIDLSQFYKKQKSQNYYYFKPKPLNEFNIFPIDSQTTINDFTIDENEFIKEHSKLLEAFKEEIKKLTGISDFGIFIETFYKLFEKYTSRVLSAGYYSNPDISLFDHSRITAALALCFEEGDSQKPILMVKGDITGIQNYIYGEIFKAENIAKRLRARSFSIQLLLETISSLFIERLKIYSPNLLYIGGGHFVLIAPNNETNRKKVIELEREIGLKLLESYFGRISFVSSYLELSGEEFIKNFEESYNKLEILINANKKRKNLGILQDTLTKIFQAKNFREHNNKIDREEEKLGTKLVKSKWIVQVIYDATQSYSISKALEPITFKKFHTFYFLTSDETELENIIISNAKAKSISIIKLNDTDFLLKDRSIFKDVISKFWFVGNYVPNKDGIVLSFEELAKIDSENYPLLGVLRLDVDSLGALFRFGLKEQADQERKYSPSRIAYLSRELNLFFNWYINELARKHSIYIAYSGGDDVFVVGSWIKILNFAKELRSDFYKFSSSNNYLSISGGIILTKPNFPISQSAILAGEQEKLAKKTENPFEKDRIGIFDVSLSWMEFNECIQKAERILSVINTAEEEINKKIIPRSFIHSLLNLTKKSFDEYGKINVKEFIKSKNKILYQFARKNVTNVVFEKQNLDNGEKIINDVLYELAFDFIKKPRIEEFFKKFQLTASIVLYKTRR